MSDKSPRRTRACREEISLSVNNMPIGKYNIWDIRDVEESFHSLCLKESVTTKRQYDFDVKDIEPDLLRCFFDRLKDTMVSFLKDDDDFLHEIKKLSMKANVGKHGYTIVNHNTILNIK